MPELERFLGGDINDSIKKYDFLKKFSEKLMKLHRNNVQQQDSQSSHSKPVQSELWETKIQE